MTMPQRRWFEFILQDLMDLIFSALDDDRGVNPDLFAYVRPGEAWDRGSIDSPDKARAWVRWAADQRRSVDVDITDVRATTKPFYPVHTAILTLADEGEPVRGLELGWVGWVRMGSISMLSITNYLPL